MLSHHQKSKIKQYESINESVRCIDNSPEKIAKLLLALCGDVESNPGPELHELTMATLNTRGLKNKNKLTQLINRIQKSHNPTSNLIFALQETHVEFNDIKYKWKGNHIFTNGCGSRGGLITLLSDNITVSEQYDIDNEAQISLVEIIEPKQKLNLILANIHSPCPHDENKIKYYETIRDKILEIQNRHTEASVIILGDFNTTFNNYERNGTTRTPTEISIARRIETLFLDFNLTDCWESDKTKMTWRHGEKMSRLDRIQWSYEINSGTEANPSTDWTYTQSDHCAVVVRIKKNFDHRRKDKIVRLDTFFMTNVMLKQTFLSELRSRSEQVSDTQMNPHQTLEYLKMTIRSIAIEVSSNYKKECEKEMNTLREETNFWQQSVENASTEYFRKLAMEKLDETICKRNKILNEKGEFLSNRLQTQWYQEGERGTKYFLNMQRAKGNKTKMVVLQEGDNKIDNPDKIDQMVEEFYKKLYEKGDSKEKQSRDTVNNFLRNINKLEDDTVKNLDLPLTSNELLETLKSCSDSSPGPDGIPYSIIKLTWPLFGPALINSWNYSLKTGNLTHSHEESYLKLLPKEGKDLNLLKNWRPITLSNCDFKIITKTLATRLSHTLKDTINPNQTAYIKNRQISDNLHVLQYSIEKAVEYREDMMVVSLDAEKAFDSIEHWYIRKILDKLGLNNFKVIFDILYRNQNVSIQLNNHSAGRYKIRNGVKQGDALSCILFILGIEPLIKNISLDPNITAITLNNITIPKIISYADDVACIIRPDCKDIQLIFDHYQLLTESSGLKLNADKTEIITTLNNGAQFDIKYCNKIYEIIPLEDIKVNGLQIGFNIDNVRNKNFKKVLNSVERQLAAWSNRYLSLLAKILIFKTYGLSQILFVASTTVFTKSQESQLNNLIYKFLWNRDMTRNKAPDRIKRSILLSESKALGFGMIDFRDIIDSLRIRTVLRLLKKDNTHPMHMILDSSTSNSVINLKVLQPVRPSLDKAILQINKIWGNSIYLCPDIVPECMKEILLNEFVGDLVCNRFKKQRLVIRHKHDTLFELLMTDRNHPVLHKIEKRFKRMVNLVIPSVDQANPRKLEQNYFPDGKKVSLLHKISSRSIRSQLKQTNTPDPKMIPNPDPVKLKRLGNLINRLTNTKLKTILLRSIHGDIYCGTRLKKFGLSDTENCPRCQLPETIDHQLYSCSYTKLLWDLVSKVTSIPTSNLSQIIGYDDLHDRTTLTLHAELLSRLLSIERPKQEPKTLLKSAITKLSIVEKNITKHQIKQMLITLDRIT